MANTCMEPKKSPFPKLATGLLVFNAYNLVSSSFAMVYQNFHVLLMEHILSENEEI